MYLGGLGLLPAVGNSSLERRASEEELENINGGSKDVGIEDSYKYLQESFHRFLLVRD